MSRPIDHAARDAATHELGVSFALSAGAGSGKTAVLASRVTELLTAGVPPARIAAITFTEKAAGELQRRVRDQLEERLAAAPSATLEAALASFHELTLSTIHAFCRALLAAEPLDSGWAPGTEIVDSDSAAHGRALAAWRKRIRAEDPHLRMLLLHLGVDDRKLRRALDAIVVRRDLELAVTGEPLDWEAAAASLRAYREDVMALAARCTAPKTCKLMKNTEPFRDALASWTQQGVPGVLTALTQDHRSVGASLVGGSAKVWPDDAHKAYKEAIRAFEGWKKEQLAPVHRVVVQSLREVALEEVPAHRRRRAVADFDDLLFRAKQLLADDAVRARLAGRYDALLVDEMQDTDPIQAEVAALLAREPERSGPWRRHAPAPGKLFAVGDPKQSIYRFRRADFTVWSDLEELVRRAGPGGRLETLRQNFRSVPGIVRWVNHTFADMPGYVAQVPFRQDAELEPVVLVDARFTEDDTGDAAELETDRVLRHLLTLREGGRVVDPATGELRPVRWGDVMMLVPRWSNAQRIAARLLAAGVPVVVEGGGAFFETDEVRLSLSALRALDEPSDSEAIVHVLRGLFGFSAEELATHLREGGSWRYTIAEQPDTDVARALAVLRELRAEVHETGSWIPRLDALLERTRATAVWSLLVDGPARLANLDKLRAILRELEATTRSPSQVVAQLKELEWQKKEDELPILDADNEAVRVTTIFKAKGLEAPIVVLLDMHRKPENFSVVVDRRAGTMHLRVAPLEPPGWDDALAAEKAEQEAERRRWMYVAATRARDQLVIARGPEQRFSLRPHLARGLAEGEHGERVQLAPDVFVQVIEGEALPPAPGQEQTFPGRDATIDALLAAPAGQGDPAGEQRAAQVAAAVQRARRKCPRWRSVGEVVAKRRRADPETGGTGVGRDGGVVVHRVMEHLDLGAERDALLAQAPALTRALGAEAGLTDAQIEACGEVLQQILAHEVFDRARQAPEHWKEVPFAMHEAGRVVSGVIDLAFPIDPERRQWVVVDYKSDAPAPGSPLREKYAAQVAIYAKALLQTVAPCESVEPIVVGPFVELAEDDAEEAVALVDGALRDVLRGLLDDGAGIPAVGLDVGDPVVASLELAWEAPKVGLGLDLTDEERRALAELGWEVVTVHQGEASWVQRAEAGLRERLGLAPRGADETGAGETGADAAGADAATDDDDPAEGDDA